MWLQGLQMRHRRSVLVLVIPVLGPLCRHTGCLCFPALLLMSCATLGKLLDLSEPRLSICKVGTNDSLMRIERNNVWYFKNRSLRKLQIPQVLPLAHGTYNGTWQRLKYKFLLRGGSTGPSSDTQWSVFFQAVGQDWVLICVVVCDLVTIFCRKEI